MSDVKILDARVAVCQIEKIFDFSDEKNPGGRFRPMFLLLAQAIRVNFTYVLAERGKFGSPDADGNYDGMIGLVQRNEADLSVWPTSYQIPEKSVKFTPMGEGMIEIVTPLRLIEPVDGEITDSFENIQYSYWIIFWAFVGVIFSIWKLASKWNPRYARYDLLWGIFGVVLNEGFKMPLKTSLRILLLSFVVLVMLTKMHFSGMYKTSLVKFPKPNVINTLEEVLQSGYRPLLFRSDPDTNSFKYRKGVMQRVWERAEEMGLEESMVDLELFEPIQLRKLTRAARHSALIAPHRLIELIQIIYCDFLGISTWTGTEKILRQPTSFILTRNISEDLENHILSGSYQILEFGLFKRLDDTFGTTAFPLTVDAKVSECLRGSNTFLAKNPGDEQQVMVHHCFTLFAVSIAMVIFPLILIVSEYLFTKWAARQRAAPEIPMMSNTVENLIFEGIWAPGLEAASLRLSMRSTGSMSPDRSNFEPDIIQLSPLEMQLQVESAELD